MGKTVALVIDPRDEQYEFEVTGTIDGEEWEAVLFESVEEAREHARGILEAGGDVYVRRIVQIATMDLFDREPDNMRIVQRCGRW